MTETLSGFWSTYITIIVVLSILGCAVLLLVQDLAKNKTGQPTGHVWDETLEEYDNPLPNWWRWLFYVTIIFSFGYLYFYPGLGNHGGAFNWTSHGQYDKEVAAAKAKYDPAFEAYLKQDIVALSQDKAAQEMGKTLFLTHCMQCHGSDARGARGFPNLTDGDWLYGGDAGQIEASILDGRHGMMPPSGGNPEAVGGASGARELAHYVRSLAGLPSDSILADKGKARYDQVCMACHGTDGQGNPAMGAPNLTDRIWLYGSREETLVETILNGRTNQMPAHRERLGDAKSHLLAAYVYGLSRPAVAPQTGAAP